MKRFWAVWAIVLLLALLFPGTLQVLARYPAAVTLVRFEAFDYGGIFMSIQLQWETASELDSAGFYVTRSLSPTGTFVRISEFYPSQGDDMTGEEYDHEDEDVVAGVVYYYKLEMVDTQGNSTFTDPVGGALGGTPTVTAFSATPTRPSPTPTTPAPTPTLTSPPSSATTPTRTATLTSTPTNPLPTRTPTSFPVVTFTRAPSQTPTPTEEATVTLTPTPEPTATTTLIPLPSITLIFLPPTATETSTSTALFLRTPTHTLTPPPPPPAPQLPMRISFLAVVVGLLWLCLGGFLIVYLQKSRTLL